jgi:hypothetical protein
MKCAEALEKPKPEAPDLPVVLVAAVALIDPDGKPNSL